jgi:23S rRNA (guanosine2251-2'-O)-methyltransferase
LPENYEIMRKVSISEMNRISAEEFKKSEKIPVTVILDNIRSLHNVGSVFRTSDAFRIEKIYLCGLTSIPPHPEIHKTALGAEYSVEWEYSENIIETILSLKSDDYKIISIEQTHESIMLNDYKVDLKCKYALILGNEVKGVQQIVVDNCDECIEIPQSGTKHSLNVSVAAGIVLWHFFEKLQSVII